jgi:prepilin-type N-terminal cleavage/methylation domain-containing protein
MHPVRPPALGTRAGERETRVQWREERGFTLVELLVTMVMSLIVIVVPMTWIITSMNQQNQTASRALSASQAEAGLGQLSRDLREVVAPTSGTNTSTLTWGPSSATATLTLPAGSQGASTETVTWSCTFGSAGSCTRQVAGTPTVTATPIRNVNSLSFAPVSASGSVLTSPASNPAYVGVTLSVQDTKINSQSTAVNGAPAIILTDGADLRDVTQ